MILRSNFNVLQKKNRYDWLKCQEGKQYTCYWLGNGGGRDGIDTVTMNKEEEREEERKKYKKKENKIRNKNEIRHYNFATFRNCKRMKKVVIQKCFSLFFVSSRLSLHRPLSCRLLLPSTKLVIGTFGPSRSFTINLINGDQLS